MSDYYNIHAINNDIVMNRVEDIDYYVPPQHFIQEDTSSPVTPPPPLQFPQQAHLKAIDSNRTLADVPLTNENEEKSDKILSPPLEPDSQEKVYLKFCSP